jgi:phosphomannomutase
MALIKSIAGVRGTIGGGVGDSLTPIDIVSITMGFSERVIEPTGKKKVIIGRDARPSGVWITQLVSATLQSLGWDVVDLGLSTTPTVGLAIAQEQAAGGIIISASHNPAHWNALKLFNQSGEYIDGETAQQVFAAAGAQSTKFASADQMGTYVYDGQYIQRHIDQIITLPLVDKAAIKARKFKVAVDAVNSTGGLAVPALLKQLAVDYTPLYCTPDGIFPHDPEPITQNLGELIACVQGGEYDLGIAIDPDVDRLVIIDEQGIPWGEEYTLVAAADYVLQHTPGNTVSNVSSSHALAVVTHQHGGKYENCPVGEMHVVAAMKATQAVIGGEGNGGVIYPPLHYGRDALVGIALLLSYLAKSGKTASQLRRQYPDYEMIKIKIPLTADVSPDLIMHFLQQAYQDYPTSTLEGFKVILKDGWFHIRVSNTEPLMRMHVEGYALGQAHAIATEVIDQLAVQFPFIKDIL